MTTVLSNFSSIKKLGDNLTSLKSSKSCFFSEKTIEKIFSSQNFEKRQNEFTQKLNEMQEIKLKSNLDKKEYNIL